jgi:hypothetical protein
MIRSLGPTSWCLLAVGAFAGCRVGYDEIFVIGRNVAGQGGTSASGGNGATGGSSGGVGGTEAGAGEAGADAMGGTSGTGGAGGTAASGGSSATGGKGGASANGGKGGAGGSAGATAGGSAGSSGGTAGATGGATSGASGASGASGTSGGMGGASGGGAGGASGGGASGASGGGAGGASGGGASGASGGGAGGASGGGASGASGAGGYAGASSLGDCQTGTFGGHDYVFCNVNLAWTVARDRCASIGMALVRVNDATESQWVFDNVYDTPPRQGVWLGANDIATEGEWRWPDGALFWLGTSMGSAQNGLFSAWYPTSPSGQGPRDCAALDGGTLGWYDLDCMTPQPYICESP